MKATSAFGRIENLQGTRSTACSAGRHDRETNTDTNEYDDPRAHALRDRYRAAFGGDELPVPVESIAEDLLGLAVEARELPVSGMLLPAERRILVNASEPEPRQRFTIAHELGHWICQCLEGTSRPVFCRAEEVGVDPEARALEREANIFAANLVMPEEAVRAVGGENRFGVSDEALAWRLYNLGVTSKPPREQKIAAQ